MIEFNGYKELTVQSYLYIYKYAIQISFEQQYR